MDYVRLGKSGLKVSRIALGCMTYGDPARGNHSWVLDEAASQPFIKKALELGINFFDTANAYSIGASEEVVGRALKKMGKREDLVIASKVYFKMRETPNGGGLSRKAIMHEIDASLKRLDVDYIDLYQIHRFDPETPLEETLEALHDLVKSGKVRYLGASSMQAWQFARALYLADLHNWTRFVSMQPHYNLLYREEEREMLNLCAEEGIGVVPWSPLARGILARPWQAKSETERGKTDKVSKRLYDATEAKDQEIVQRVADIASRRGVPQAQIALAWMLSKPVITSPIIGASKPHHLEDAVAALSIHLDESEIKALEELYVPHEVSGF